MATKSFRGRCFTTLLLLLSLSAFYNSIVPTEKAPAQPAEPTVTLTAVGDILLDRGIAKKIEKFGIDYPFAHVGDELRKADIAFGNLECPLSKDGVKVTKPFVFRAKPEYAECLEKAGLDMLSLANNHALDCGRDGLVETQKHLKARGIRWCGAGATHAAAQVPEVMEVRGLKIAFIGYCDFMPEGTFWREDRPTIAMADAERVTTAVAAGRKAADVVVVSFHWGVEYSTRPSKRQIELAHAATDAGADLVLGHHPHVLQGLEVVPAGKSKAGRRSLIAYSLGNFVFDSPQKWTKATANTMLLRCKLNKSGLVSAEVVPARIEEFRPRLATGKEAKLLLARVMVLAGELGTKVEQGRVALR